MEVTRSNPTWVTCVPCLAGGCGAPRGIVVVGMDPWIPCHASTSSTPVVDSPSYKKKVHNSHKINISGCPTSSRMIVTEINKLHLKKYAHNSFTKYLI